MGPLDFYRKRATFDWKKLKVFIDSEEIIKYQNALYDYLQNHPEFKPRPNLTFDEERRQATRQAFVLKTSELLSQDKILNNYRVSPEIARILVQFTPSSYIKSTVSNNLFTTVLMSMGSERHSKFLEDSLDGKIYGCYALTEIAHGSNARGMQTKATFDKTTQEFILNSPDFGAAKCWVGALGQMASHAIVYAQLILNNVNYGLHIFVVPIRDPQTLLPHKGVIVGDMGEKIGLNGIDNGFVMFKNYRIPRDNLLNKVGDVNENGEYITQIKDPNKRHGASLGSLSVGRVNITVMVEAMGVKAITIALRYAAVRKQFGPNENTEIPLIEYQSHQYRLLPYLAACYAFRIFGSFLSETLVGFIVDSLTGSNKANLGDLGMELHGISSASKPVCGWTMKEAIQECRECCGGHGYLKAAGLGSIRNDHDANLTYEGENHVLIQQTSNFLLKFWPKIQNKEEITTPLHSIDFLTNFFTILQSKYNDGNILDPQTIISAYQWLVCYLFMQTNEKLEKNLKSGKDLFSAKNDCQVFYAKKLSIAYIQYFILRKMLDKINESTDLAIKNVLLKLFTLYGLFSIEKQHLGTFYQGNYGISTNIVQDTILQLCVELKNEAISLVDAIAPPDFILNSVLGNSDGQVYQHLEKTILSKQHSRPEWWRDIVNWQNYVNCKSKL